MTQSEEPTVPMVNVTICGIPTQVPKVYYDWITHLAECPNCYRFNYKTWSRDDSCKIEKELHRKLDEYNCLRSKHEESKEITRTN